MKHLRSEKINQLVDGELSSLETETSIQHISKCADCRRKFASFNQISRSIGSLPREAIPPNDCWEEIRRRCESDHKMAGFLISRRPNWMVFAAGCAFVFFLVLIVFQFNINSTEQQPVVRLDKAARVKALLSKTEVWDQITGIQQAARIDQLPVDTIQALLRILQTNQNNQVRLAAAITLSAHADHALVQANLARAILAQESPVVQMEILNIIAGTRLIGAAEILRLKLEDGSLTPVIRAAIEQTIEEIPG